MSTKPNKTAFTIDQCVPIPRKSGGSGAPPKYPFGSMEVGESFFMEASSEEDIKPVRSAASRYAKRNGLEFASRTVDGGVRVWRTA